MLPDTEIVARNRPNPSLFVRSKAEFTALQKSSQVLSTDCRKQPSQIWTRLADDRRMRVILLMAQLAFKLVTNRSELLEKESNYATSICFTQDSI